MSRRTLKDLTQEQLKELFHYEPGTGVFTWKKSRSGIKKCSVAGYLNPIGYVVIMIYGKAHLAHRLAFLYSEGYLPEFDIDHINRNRSDNRWSNLRHVSRTCNMRNRKVSKSSTSGVTGVLFCKKRTRWGSEITINTKTIRLGSYKDIGDAVARRWEAEKEYGFPNCNTTSSAYLYLKNAGLIDKDDQG